MDNNVLNLMVQIIDMCAERGSFKGSELATIAAVRNKLLEELNKKPETSEIDGNWKDEQSDDGSD